MAWHEPLPICPVPLLAPDADVLLYLSEVLTRVPWRGAYARGLDYTAPGPPPPLQQAM